MWKKINNNNNNIISMQLKFRSVRKCKIVKIHTHKHAYTLNFNRAESRNRQSKQRKIVLDTPLLKSKAYNRIKNNLAPNGGK